MKAVASIDVEKVRFVCDNECVTLMRQCFLVQADATVEADKSVITQMIKAETGFRELNGVVIEWLNEWLASTGKGALAQMTSEKRGLSKLSMQVASLLMDLDKLDEAESILQEAVSVRKRVLGPSHLDTLESEGDLACVWSYQGQADESAALRHKVLEVMRAILGNQHRETLIAIGNLGASFRQQGQLEEAEELLQEALSSHRARGTLETEGGAAMNQLSFVFEDQGKLDEAEALIREELDISTRNQGARHPDTINGMGNLGGFLMDCGKLLEAEPLLRAAADLNKELLGKDHRKALNSKGNLGRLLLRQACDQKKLVSLTMKQWHAPPTLKKCMCVQEGTKVIRTVLQKLQGKPHKLPASHPWIRKFQGELE